MPIAHTQRIHARLLHPLLTLLIFSCLTVGSVNASNSSSTLTNAHTNPQTKSQTNNTELDQLLDLVNQRLSLMKDVAAYKFANNIAIENKQREIVVLRSAMSKSQQNQLQPQSVESFFRLQIQIAKEIQHHWIEHWKKEQGVGVSEKAIPNLSTEIRPKLIKLGQQIVDQLSLALPELHDNTLHTENQTKIETAITVRFISTEMKQQLLHALSMIQKQNLSRNHLETILQKGTLRVGTTGDYKPFSFIKPNASQYSGIDIDLAQDLATSLGVELTLVKTSWPTLMTDFAAQQFDVGMSGISRTLLRRRLAFFSNAYFTGGKTPIARCSMVAQLNTLEKIDQPKIRVIVNPGGTNEKYLQQNIHNAQRLLHSDNRTIFQQILNNKADVMITDDIEVRLQHTLHPQLCATMPGKLLTHSEKGFLLPQDIALKEYVDAWLEQLKISGKLEALFTRYLDNR
ncbi:MAG: gamma subclass chorismate mutase AroQ [Pseudomonadales bacterium]|nr:gamma subclass chorismate mutase AroQ [Pseudomonadales bacterium]